MCQNHLAANARVFGIYSGDMLLRSLNYTVTEDEWKPFDQKSVRHKHKH